MTSTFDQFIDHENFMHAWRIIRNSDRYEPKDRLGIEIFAAQTDKHADILIDLIKSNKYQPDKANIIWNAKRDKTPFPIAFLNMHDRWVYQSLGNIILKNIYPSIKDFFNRSVFAHVPQPPHDGTTLCFYRLEPQSVSRASTQNL
jgi:hypothetical protein